MKFNCNFSNEEVNKGVEDERWKALLSRQGAFCFGEGWYYPAENGSFIFAPRTEIPENVLVEIGKAKKGDESGADKQIVNEEEPAAEKQNPIEKSETKIVKRDVGKIIKNWCGGRWELALESRYHLRDFSRFIQRFKDIAQITEIEDDDKLKLTIMRHQCDDKAQKIVDMALKEIKGTGNYEVKGSFELGVKWIEKYCKANCNLRAEKQLLKRMKQKSGETFSEFANRVADQAELCGYSEIVAKENAVETIINNCTNRDQLFKMTIQEKDTESIDLQTIIRWGMSLEMGAFDQIEDDETLRVSVVRNSKQGMEKRMGRMMGQPRNNRCTKCNDDRHDTQACWLWEDNHRDLTCYKCEGKGHLARACTKPFKRRYENPLKASHSKGNAPRGVNKEEFKKETYKKEKKQVAKVSGGNYEEEYYDSEEDSD